MRDELFTILMCAVTGALTAFFVVLISLGNVKDECLTFGKTKISGTVFVCTKVGAP